MYKYLYAYICAIFIYTCRMQIRALITTATNNQPRGNEYEYDYLRCTTKCSGGCECKWTGQSKQLKRMVKRCNPCRDLPIYRCCSSRWLHTNIHTCICLTKYRAWLEGSEVLGGSFLCRLLIAYLHIFIYYKNNVLLHMCVCMYIFLHISDCDAFCAFGVPPTYWTHCASLRQTYIHKYLYICAYTQVYLLSFNWALDIRATFVSICLFSHIFHFFIFPFAYLHILFHSFFNWSANT